MNFLIDILLIFALVFMAIFLDGFKKVSVNLPRNIENVELHNLSKHFKNSKFISRLKLSDHMMDLIVINEKGIIVIRALSYSGAIKGNEMGEKWSCFFDDIEFNFTNPIVENDHFINAVRILVGYDCACYSMVHFLNDVNLEINYSQGDDLYVNDIHNLDAQIEEIYHKDSHISEEEIERIYSRLSALK